METKTIKSESELIGILQGDIRDSGKESIKILAGHLPVLYEDNGPGKRSATLSANRWGEFSPYTFELGCRLARYARNRGKGAGILIMSDDLVEVPKDENGHRKITSWMPRATRNLYREQQNLLPEYQKIAQQYGVLENIVEQTRSFGKSKFISEMSVIFQAMQAGRTAPNECSLAYNAMLDNPELFNPDADYLISFIPGQCKGNIYAILNRREDLDASHIFFPHIEIMGGILGTSSGFLKLGKEASRKELYEAGIRYVKN